MPTCVSGLLTRYVRLARTRVGVLRRLFGQRLRETR